MDFLISQSWLTFSKIKVLTLNIFILYVKIDGEVFILSCSMNFFGQVIFGFFNEKTGDIWPI